MGTFDYSEFGQLAVDLLEEFGEKADFNCIGEGVPPDPEKEWVPGEHEVTVHKDVRIAFLPDDRDNREWKNRTRRSNVGRGTVQAYMEPVSFVPELTDTVFRKSESKTFSIESIVQVKPSEQAAVLYVMRLK